MPTTRLAAPLALAAGLAAPGLAQDLPAVGMPTVDAQKKFTGHLYINAATGASVFTPAKEYLANRAQMPLRALGDDINGDGTPDLWINTNTDPCPIGTTTNPNTNIAALDTPTTQGDHHLYKSQFGTRGGPALTDVHVETITFTFHTDLEDTDTNLDTIPDGNTNGVGIEISFWDKEDFFGKTCCFCGGGPEFTRRRIITIPVSGLPGTLTPGELAGTVVTLDLGTDQQFELADSDGIGPANGNFNPFIGALDTDTNSDTVPDVHSADSDGNGTIDWSYSFRGIQPTDGRTATIGYTLAAPGRFGPAGEFAIDGVTPLNAQAGVMGDGLIDYINRTTAPAPLQFDNTRIKHNSIETPMGRSFPFTSSAIGTTPETLTALSRFSMFFASLGEQPDPLGPPPVSAFSCAGLANSDFFGWGATHPPNDTFYGSLNCVIDDDGDTIPEGRPWSGAFLALSGEAGDVPGCECNGDGVLNLDDIDCFVTAFLTGDLIKADCDGNGTLNIDDIDCFVYSFLAGCF